MRNSCMKEAGKKKTVVRVVSFLLAREHPVQSARNEGSTAPMYNTRHIIWISAESSGPPLEYQFWNLME